jgi:hypothetical protein
MRSDHYVFVFLKEKVYPVPSGPNIKRPDYRTRPTFLRLHAGP